MKKIIIILPLFLIITACQTIESDRHFAGDIITATMSINNFYADMIIHSGESALEISNSLEFYFTGKKYKKGSVEFSRYVQIFGDNHYKPIWGELGASLCTDTINAIDVFLNADYNSDFPEGKNLNEIIDVYFYTALKYIKNGYKGDSHEIYKMSANSIDPIKTVLRHSEQCKFEFKELSTLPPDKSFLLNIKITFSSERKIEKTFSLRFKGNKN